MPDQSYSLGQYLPGLAGMMGRRGPPADPASLDEYLKRAYEYSSGAAWNLAGLGLGPEAMALEARHIVPAVLSHLTPYLEGKGRFYRAPEGTEGAPLAPLTDPGQTGHRQFKVPQEVGAEGPQWTAERTPQALYQNWQIQQWWDRKNDLMRRAHDVAQRVAQLKVLGQVGVKKTNELEALTKEYENLKAEHDHLEKLHEAITRGPLEKLTGIKR